MEKKQAQLYYIPGIGYTKVYTFNGEVVPHAVLDSKISKHYAGYRLLAKDLDLVKKGVEELRTNTFPKEHIINVGLTSLVIIAYGKCFSKADGRIVKLDNAGALKSCTKKEVQLHYELIEMRNKYIAHAGSTEFERNPVMLAKIVDGDRVGFKIFDNVIYMSAINVEVGEYDSLIAKITTYVEEKILTLGELLMKEVDSEIDWNNFDKNSFIPTQEQMSSMDDIRLRFVNDPTEKRKLRE